MPQKNDTSWELLVTESALKNIAKTRSKDMLECTVPKRELDTYIARGWEIKRELKTRVQLTKKKNIGDSFEDELWSVFYKMGFKTMNATNQFVVSYDDHRPLTKQVDIIAIDDETCIFVECKEAIADGTKHNFSLDISEIGALKHKLFNEISKKYPGRKFKYIFATKNYVLGEQDKNRLHANDITYFDYNTVLYYKALTSHLGSASRYQLLGSLFAGTKIKGMSGLVPAIRGFMGGLTYYTFLIEPDSLLKIGYVLHRTNANNDYDELLPSYQRLIKKERLKSVRSFINNGGFFPNSLIISIDAKKPLVFDIAGKEQNGDSKAKMGVLHLPQTYQSAYIIDGQHRLYGYSDSDFAANNTIPVVAFENLSKEKQLRLFMEINENQKEVSKTLRNILEIDIYNDSEDPSLRKKALLGRIGKRLGEDPKSPLYGRVIIGEDAQTEKCCITLEFLKIALDKTQFFNRYKKNGTLIEAGLFDKGNNDDTVATVYPLLLKLFSSIRENSTAEWNNDSDGYLTTNNAIVAVVRVFNDIVNIVVEKDPTLIDDINALYANCEYFVLLLSETLNTLPAEKRKIVREARGVAANESPYRTIQMAMHEADPEFTNESIEKYYKENGINYNDHAKIKITDIRKYFVECTKQLFPEDNWLSIYAAEEHEVEITNRVTKKRIANARNGIDIEIDIWQELTLLDIVKIIQNGSNWSTYYKDIFHAHGIDKSKGDVISLLKAVCDQEVKINNGSHITWTSYSEITELHKVIIDS